MRTLMGVVALAVGVLVYATLPAIAEEKAAEKPGGVLVVVIQDLNLTDEQEAKIADIRKDFRTKNGEALKELASVAKEEMEKVGAVLTPEQKTKLATLKEERKEARQECLAHRIANLKELDLTDEQKTKLADIRKEYRPKIQEAGNKLRAAVREEIEMIAAVIKA